MRTPESWDGTVRDPVDRLASIVTSPTPKWAKPITSKRGSQDDFREQISWVLRHPSVSAPSNVKDWTGVKLGRISVVAYSHARRLNDGDIRHYWVVRCSCGEYEMRRSESLAKLSPHQMCKKCEKNEWLRTGGVNVQHKPIL